MQDIQKLKDELAAAQATLRNAEEEARSAKQRLSDAYGENSDLIGHAIQYETTRGWGKNAKAVQIKILVRRVGEKWTGDLVAYGKKIVASGAVGVMDGEVKIADAIDLGAYVATDKAAEAS